MHKSAEIGVGKKGLETAVESEPASARTSNCEVCRVPKVGDFPQECDERLAE